MSQNKKYHTEYYEGLTPKSKRFLGGEIAPTHMLDLDEAAKMASKHAGTEVMPRDFLRAAGSGKIILLAIIKSTARMRLFNQETDFLVSGGDYAQLPIRACRELANQDRAKWRTVEDFDYAGRSNLLKCYTKANLIDGEPDLETTTADCRVWGYGVHALADAFIQMNSQVKLVAAEEKATTRPPQPRRAAQDAVILDAIRNAGHDPLALPINERGRPGVKAGIRAGLVGVNSLFPKNGNVFKKAWERLREHGDIVDKA